MLAFTTASAVTPQTLQQLIQAQQTDTLPQRITIISAVFLNSPYQLEPLGEGINGEFNQEPLYRFDQFDCETYVDTVLALAMANNWQQFQQVILQLRYHDGKPDFFTRNHFPEADWLPNIIQKGYATNITSVIAQANQLDTLSEIIYRKRWAQSLSKNRLKLEQSNATLIQQKLQELHQQAGQLKNTTVSLTFIKVSSFPALIDKIPNSAIILLVKPLSLEKQQALGTSLLISHLGFAIWKNHILYLRAASSLFNKVIDLPLLPYLQSQPNVIGFVVLMPQQQR